VRRRRTLDGGSEEQEEEGEGVGRRGVNHGWLGLGLRKHGSKEGEESNSSCTFFGLAKQQWVGLLY
jgi:hypothetical protein